MVKPYPVVLYNDLTHMKEKFVPVEEGKVRFYSCGPTTYSFLHVGNGMALVVGDMIHRVFKALGWDVTYVRNFTDVDDKIINAANKRGIDALVHSQEFVDECKKDMESLHMLPATHTPKVSEQIPEIIEMVKTLIDKGHAYVEDGEVLFSVPSFSEYGKLSKKDLKSLEHGIRVEVDDHKHHPSDFVLWKPAKPGEPSWDSPWGKGRPGWHIECSAMAKKFLGDTIDLHHGGSDLIFPHHENEIAQSECCNDCSFSNYWVHNGFLVFGEGEKMSKSLGNVVTIREFVEKFGGEVLRQILLSSHYRSKIEWGNDAIARAFNEVERIHKFVKAFNEAAIKNKCNCEGGDLVSLCNELIESMKKDLANDFNITGCMASFFTLIRKMNKEYLDEMGNFNDKKKLTEGDVTAVRSVIDFVALATGLINDDADDVLNRLNLARKNLQDDGDKNLSDDEINELVKKRLEAKANKDWATADKIRNELAEMGIVIKDNPDKTCTWSYK